MSIRNFDYLGSPIQFDDVNGQIMANATLMCKAFNKRPAEWQRLESVKKYIKTIVGKSHISENQLITTIEGSPEFGGGTWIHEKLILKLAQWLDVDFEIWCNDRLAEFFL